MKKLLLFSLLLWQFNCELKAQAYIYHPFPTDSAVWLHQGVISNGGPTFSYDAIKMLGDTLINNITYKKLYRSGSPNFNQQQYNPYSSLNGNYYCGALRQDVAQKKVYFKPLSGNEQILYDFNLSVGDTVVYNSPGINSNQYPHKSWVISIDSTLVGSNLHKIYNLDNFVSGSPYGPGSLIEGVGHTGGFGYIYDFTFENYNSLICFSVKNSTRLFPNPGSQQGNDQCALSVGISELIDNKIKIAAMPNPATDIVNLIITCDSKYIVEVKNNLGQSVYTSSNSTLSNLLLDFSEYDKGIYFIRITDSKSNSAVKKIIKQ